MHLYFISDPRFSQKIHETDSGCWEYTGVTGEGGYGYVRRRPRQLRAHRYAWELVNGSVPDGMFVCHRCDNRKCCNPDHLFLGTHRDNMDDMIGKGRLRTHAQDGENNGNSRLDWETVQKIRELYAIGASQMQIGKMYGISNSSVHLIVHHKTWIR